MQVGVTIVGLHKRATPGCGLARRTLNIACTDVHRNALPLAVSDKRGVMVCMHGATENAGLELNGPKSQRWKMKDERPRSIAYITHVVFTSSN